MANLLQYKNTPSQSPKFFSQGLKVYAKVAEFIATDKELAIYHRFDRTAARILLVMQSEILFKQK